MKLTVITGGLDWQERAACIGTNPDLFFPNAKGRTATQEAKPALNICNRCPVRPACLAYALDPATYQAFGIWGGTTEKDRRQLRRNRRERAA